MVEACFKGFGRALRQAIRIDGTECRAQRVYWRAFVMIAIVDSGGANIASVQFALERLGADWSQLMILTSSVLQIRCCCQGLVRTRGNAASFTVWPHSIAFERLNSQC